MTRLTAPKRIRFQLYLGRDTDSILSAARILSLAIFGKSSVMLEKAAFQGLANLHANAQDRMEQRLNSITPVFGRQAQPAAEPAYYAKSTTDALVASLEAERDKNYVSTVRNGALYEGAVAQRDAVIEALRALSPNHPVLQNSASKFKDGKPKSKLRLIFEAAFDKDMLRVGGIFANPKAYRTD